MYGFKLTANSIGAGIRALRRTGFPADAGASVGCWTTNCSRDISGTLVRARTSVRLIGRGARRLSELRRNPGRLKHYRIMKIIVPSLSGRKTGEFPQRSIRISRTTAFSSNATTRLAPNQSHTSSQSFPGLSIFSETFKTVSYFL
jgi:hypothetical protein